MATQITSNAKSTIRNSGHCLVRKNKNTLYCVTEVNPLINAPFNYQQGFTVWKSTNNGKNWQSLASLAPANSGEDNLNNYQGVSCAIDATGLIHIAYMWKKIIGLGTTVQTRYVQFNTDTEAFQNDSVAVGTVATAVTKLYTDIAVNSNDADGANVHIVYHDFANARLNSHHTIGYTSTPLPGGSIFTSPVAINISGVETIYPSLCLEGQGTKLPMIAFIGYNSNTSPITLRTIAAIGNSSPPSAFTVQNPIYTVNTITGSGLPLPDQSGAPQIIQNMSGDEIVVCSTRTSDSDPIVAYHPVRCRHIHSNSWATWETPLGLGNAKTYFNTAQTSRKYKGVNQGEDIFAADGAFIQHFFNRNSPDGMPANDNVGRAPLTPKFIKTRWANYNEPNLDSIDLLIESGDNVYFLTLPNAPRKPKPRKLKKPIEEAKPIQVLPIEAPPLKPKVFTAQVTAVLMKRKFR